MLDFRPNIFVGSGGRFYREDQTEEESIALVERCVREVQKRIIINSPKFAVKIINKDGIKVLPLMG